MIEQSHESLKVAHADLVRKYERLREHLRKLAPVAASDRCCRSCDGDGIIHGATCGDCGGSGIVSVDATPSLISSAAPHETAWLVERHDIGKVRYFAMGEMGIEWVIDHAAACRFCRRVDAEMAAAGGDLMDLRIVQHAWSKP